MFLNRGQRRRSVGNGFHFVTFAQQPHQVVAHVGVIVCHQNRRTFFRGGVVPQRRTRDRQQFFVGKQVLGEAGIFRVGQPAQSFLHKRGSSKGGGSQTARSANSFRGEVCTSQRNTDSEGAAFSRRALHPHESAVQLHQFLDQCQADAAALVGSAAGIFYAVKAVEQPG